MDEAIALCRVSSKEQLLSNSLGLQGVSVRAMADKLGVPIVQKWALHTSSKKGNNLKRTDLKEAKNLCRVNKKIKYILLDRVNRLGREAKYLTFYMLDLEINYGVQLIFCDPSQQKLNGTDSKTFLKIVEKLVEGETENEEKASLANERMRALVKQGFSPFNAHPGYKKTEAADGLHVPDEPRFSLLQKGCRLIIYENHTPEQAVKWMNDNGYLTKGGKRLDTDHFTNFIKNDYYRGKVAVDKPGWPQDINGLHIPLLSKREHDLLRVILDKRNPRVRKVHNPEFPLSNLIRHFECKDIGKYEKFWGYNYNHGKRPNGRERPLVAVYDCRDCRRRVSRGKVHLGFSSYLDSLEFVPNEKQFRTSLAKVWKNQRGSVAQRLGVLKTNRANIEQRSKETAVAYASEAPGAAKTALNGLLVDYEKQIKDLDSEILSVESVDMVSADFVKFALKFVEKLRMNWWKLSKENMVRGAEILFNSKIYIANDATVLPSQLSSIYRLGTNKKALSNMDNAHLVEHLENSAPLILKEIERWRYLLWDEYLEYKREQERPEQLSIP